MGQRTLKRNLKYIGENENKNKAYENLQDTAKTDAEKFLALNAYIRNEEDS